MDMKIHLSTDLNKEMIIIKGCGNTTFFYFHNRI